MESSVTSYLLILLKLKNKSFRLVQIKCERKKTVQSSNKTVSSSSDKDDDDGVDDDGVDDDNDDGDGESDDSDDNDDDVLVTDIPSNEQPWFPLCRSYRCTCIS